MNDSVSCFVSCFFKADLLYNNFIWRLWNPQPNIRQYGKTIQEIILRLITVKVMIFSLLGRMNDHYFLCLIVVVFILSRTSIQASLHRQTILSTFFWILLKVCSVLSCSFASVFIRLVWCIFVSIWSSYTLFFFTAPLTFFQTLVCRLFGFYVISTFQGYLMPNPFLYK